MDIALDFVGLLMAIAVASTAAWAAVRRRRDVDASIQMQLELVRLEMIEARLLINDRHPAASQLEAALRELDRYEHYRLRGERAWPHPIPAPSPRGQAR